MGKVMQMIEYQLEGKIDIDVETVLNIEGKELYAYGVLQIDSAIFILSIKIDIKTINRKSKILHAKMSDLENSSNALNDELIVYGKHGEMYIVQGIHLLNKIRKADTDNITIVMQGRFKRVIMTQGEPLNKSYKFVQFSVDGIDNIFKIDEGLELEMGENKTTVKITLRSESFRYGSRVIYKVERYIRRVDIFDGTTRLAVYNVIGLEFPEIESIDNILKYIQAFKIFLEWRIKRPIRFNKIQLYNKESESLTPDILIYDYAYFYEHTCRRVKVTDTLEESRGHIFECIDNWISRYSKFKEPIELWGKTIHNKRADINDKFIWISRAFESLRELSGVRESAKRTRDEAIRKQKDKEDTNKCHRKSKKSQAPNLRQLILEVIKIYKLEDIDITTLNKVVEARNNVVHSLIPDIIDSMDWVMPDEELYGIIERYFDILIIKTFGLDIEIPR